MRIAPEIGDVSVVLVGNFNPPIFHPSWFLGNGLIGEQEASAAEIEVIHREITIFRMDWISIRVEQDRFVAETQEAPFIRLSDLVVRTFKEFLIHTPVRMLGINRRVHFSVGDEETRNRIGKTLAPHEPWGEWGKHIEGGDLQKRGGLRSLVMEQKDLDDRSKGYIRSKIEPSSKLDPKSNGIFMEINDHYEVEDPDGLSGCDEIIGILEKQFDVSIRRSEWIIDQIMALR